MDQRRKFRSRYPLPIDYPDASSSSSLIHYYLPLDLLDSPKLNNVRSPPPSRSPLSSLKNNTPSPPSIYSSPVKVKVKVEEDVIVMDGILMQSKPKSSLVFLKTEICRFWEDHGSCRYASKCQFAHGKEELHPTSARPSPKNKVEGSASKMPSTVGSFTYDTSCHSVSPAVATSGTASSVKVNWSPMDDDIRLFGIPPSSSSAWVPPTRDDINDRINVILYSSRKSQRLPVFMNICPE